MKNIMNRRRFLALSAGMATAATFEGASLFSTAPSSTAFADTPVALTIAVTQSFPQTYTHIVKGNFADPQLASQGATDLFCYDRNANIGSFYATVQEGLLDDGTPVTSGLVKIGGDHTFSRLWTHIVYVQGLQLLFYDATTGTGAFYRTDGQGNLFGLQTYTNFRTSWSQIITGQFGNANVLFYDAAGNTGQFYSVDLAGNMQLISTDTRWRSSWYSIVKCRFSGGSFDDLLFYDKAGGFGAFYKFDGQGNMILYSQHTNWRTTWNQIVVSNFAAQGSQLGLLFYESGLPGGTEIYSVDTSGNITLLPVSFPNQWSLPWQTILGGLFVPSIGTSGWGELVSYDPADAVMVSSYLFPVF